MNLDVAHSHLSLGGAQKLGQFTFANKGAQVIRHPPMIAKCPGCGLLYVLQSKTHVYLPVYRVMYWKETLGIENIEK
ncbi:hypothetical protein IL59_0212415 [Brucella suis bv. 4 str. 40]|nr:hypothetical protein IL59_0212415 [Brucella suis bv. 4 str. 40]